MKLLFFLTLLPLIVIVIVNGDDECDRPAKLLEYEESCKTDPDVTGNTGSFLEHLQESIAQTVVQTKRLINMAKSRLGIQQQQQQQDESNVEQTKKCEYYQCIFRKMNILGSNNYPNMTLMTEWAMGNLDDVLKDTTVMKVESCFNAVAMNVDPEVEEDYEAQTSCGLALKIIMCLQTDATCSAFKYP